MVRRRPPGPSLSPLWGKVGAGWEKRSFTGWLRAVIASDRIRPREGLAGLLFQGLRQAICQNSCFDLEQAAPLSRHPESFLAGHGQPLDGGACVWLLMVFEGNVAITVSYCQTGSCHFFWRDFINYNTCVLLTICYMVAYITLNYRWKT